MTDIAFSLDAAQVAQFIVAFVLPVLVGLVTTRVTASGTKAVLLATLNLVNGVAAGFIGAVDNGTTFDLSGALLVGLGGWTVAVATHYGLWKPTGVAETVKDHGVTAEG